MKKIISLFLIISSLLPTVVGAQALDPEYPFEVKLSTYECEDRFGFELPTREQCKGVQYKEYMEQQWMSGHEIYYIGLERLYRDNNLRSEAVVDEFYEPIFQPVIDTRPKAEQTGQFTKISKMNRFRRCTEIVCEAWEEECPKYFEEEETKEEDKGVSEATLKEMISWCDTRAQKLIRYNQVKTDMALQERIHRRERLAPLEEGMHRSVQIFFGILERGFKVLREIIDLDRKLDIYVKFPLQEEK